MTDPWAEEPPPPDAVDCPLCELAGQRRRVVWGEGRSLRPRFVLVLDNPGDPDLPEACGTRQTLRAACADAGLDPGELYVTWLLKCRPRRAYDKEAARGACLPYLRRQLAEKRPQALALFGDAVAGALAGGTVKALRTRWLRVEGRPAIVTYHPLAARRRPNLYPLVVADLQRMRSMPPTNGRSAAGTTTEPSASW